MLLLLGTLVLGFVFARLNLLPRFLHDKMKIIGTAALCLLLFSMGISMGADSQIIAALPTLGAKAFVLALAIIAGSTLLVWIAVELNFKKRAPSNSEGMSKDDFFNSGKFSTRYSLGLCRFRN